jgi:threonine 3-dehydrogenase
MKAVFKERPEPGLVLKDAPVPEVGPTDVLIKVSATTICGSDVHIDHWNSWAASNVKPPQIIGHEMCGEVVEAGELVQKPKVGDYVSVETHIVCGRCLQCRTDRSYICRNLEIVGVHRDGAWAEYVALPAANCWVNDRSLPPEHASLLEPFGNAVDTVFAEDVTTRNVLVTGAGPLGCMAAAVAKAAGAALVIATDLSDQRLELAKTMGADLVINVKKENAASIVLDATEGNGVDMVCEMSGAGAAIDMGLDLVTAGGAISFLGIPNGPVEIELTNNVIFKALRMYGITGRRIFSTWRKTHALLTSGAVDLSPLITHRFSLDDFQKGIDVMTEGNCGKVVLYPGGVPDEA